MGQGGATGTVVGRGVRDTRGERGVVSCRRRSSRRDVAGCAGDHVDGADLAGAYLVGAYLLGADHVGINPAGA